MKNFKKVVTFVSCLSIGHNGFAQTPAPTPMPPTPTPTTIPPTKELKNAAEATIKQGTKLASAALNVAYDKTKDAIKPIASKTAEEAKKLKEDIKPALNKAKDITANTTKVAASKTAEVAGSAAHKMKNYITKTREWLAKKIEPSQEELNALEKEEAETKK